MVRDPIHSLPCLTAVRFLRADFRFRILSVAFASAACTPAFAEKLVTVRSTADPSYAELRAVNNPPTRETYVFAKGSYFAGGTYDSSLYRMSFEKIVQTLAFDLQRQNYAPTNKLETADLLIVVHWGVTMPNDRGAALMAVDTDLLRQASGAVDAAREAEAADGSGVLSSLGVAAAADAEFRSVAQQMNAIYEGDDVRASTNAELLGMGTALAAEGGKMFDSTTAMTLRSMIDEERYFIVMIAYDAQKFREGKKRRLWTSRMSIRSAGVNFGLALDRMSNAGGKHHGTKQKALAMEFLTDRTGLVKIGDLKVITDEPR